MCGPLRLANEAGRLVTLRFREVPARAELLSALSFFAQLLLIRTLCFVHVHIFGIDHIARLAALWAAG
jgi:hypothetical protein